MKKILVLIFFIFSYLTSSSQINELGVFVGGSNFIGDVGETDYIHPNKLALGVLYKWNKSPRHSYRFSYTQSEIYGNDSNSEVPGRKLRGYYFENNIKEFSAGLEFNFFDFNLHESMVKKTTPFVYSGLSFVTYKGLFYDGDGNTKYDSRHGAVAIPMIVGIKSNLIKNFIIGIEVGARYTFADDIDGSSPTNKNLEDQKFGNINSNDWYVFSGITLTYTFGEKPCYCKR